MRRGFTLIEVITIVAIIGVALAIGLAGLSESIALARYRADRARVYFALAEARDTARDERRAVQIKVSAGSVVVSPLSGINCGTPIASNTIVDVPTVEPSTTTTLCFPATLAILPAGVDLGPRGSAAHPDHISCTADVRLKDNWGEFPEEGAAQASGCDIDDGGTCGR